MKLDDLALLRKEMVFECLETSVVLHTYRCPQKRKGRYLCKIVALYQPKNVHLNQGIVLVKSIETRVVIRHNVQCR